MLEEKTGVEIKCLPLLFLEDQKLKESRHKINEILKSLVMFLFPAPKTNYQTTNHKEVRNAGQVSENKAERHQLLRTYFTLFNVL